MPSILIVDKTQIIKEVSVKSFVEEDLYKKAGFKSSEHFKCHTTWSVEVGDKPYSISIYGKTEGRANQENKYDFPPPVDNLLFFGSCVLVNKQNGIAVDLKESDWKAVYDQLFGGFEDIGSENSEDEDESIEGPVTKEGYSKDGFVVDDEEGECDDDESEEEVPVVKKQKKKPAASTKKEKTVFIAAEQAQTEYLECSSELSEEAYF